MTAYNATHSEILSKGFDKNSDKFIQKVLEKSRNEGGGCAIDVNKATQWNFGDHFLLFGPFNEGKGCAINAYEVKIAEKRAIGSL